MPHAPASASAAHAAETLLRASDPLGLCPSTEAPAALAAMDAALAGLMAHRADVAQHLDAALTADPGFVPALALRGFGALLLAREDLAPRSAAALAAAEASLAERGGSGGERALVRALSLWQREGEMAAAASVLESWLDSAPRDLLTLKLVQAIRFMLGDAGAMRRTAACALPYWDEGMAGTGHVMGCLAFALEETGAFALAERLGRRGVELAPGDLWAVHAVAHVMEAQARADEGLAWLGAAAPHLGAAGAFGRHVVWHSALFHLQRGAPDAALELYDRHLAEAPPGDFRDLSNAAALLWRLQAQGVAAGPARWRHLADLAGQHAHTVAFGQLHQALAFAGAGDHAGAAALLARMRDQAAGTGSQAAIVRQVALPAAEGILAAGAGRPAEAVAKLLPLRPELSRIGGSDAQRDVFQRLLVEAAFAAGQAATAQSLLARRARRRSPGAWEQAKQALPTPHAA